MSRLVVTTLFLSLVLGACVPSLSPVSAGDVQATLAAAVQTLSAQTMAALPTPTIPPTEPPTATVPPTITASPKPLPSNTGTTAPISSITTTATFTSTVVTVTGTRPTSTTTFTPTATATGTAVVGPGTASPTALMVPREYGTQPPYISYGRVRLINQAKAQVYISFQCITPEGLEAIVEHPVSGTITVSVPAGRCHYVAWVGGREFVGDIGVSKFEEIVIKFKKDRIIIQ